MMAPGSGGLLTRSILRLRGNPYIGRAVRADAPDPLG